MIVVSQSRKAFLLGRRAALIAGLAAVAMVGAGMNQAARAQDTIFGFTTGNQLFQFQSNTPGTVTNVVGITGVTGTLLDIDFRPANGLLYGLSQSGSAFNLYTISTTGAATLVTNLTGVTAAATTYDIDFNPTANALRIVGSNGDNFRVPGTSIVPGGGATTTDTALTGGSNIVGSAYTNNVPGGAGGTTLYDINSSGQLFLQGSPLGTPNSPNAGALTAVGSGTGINAAEMAFDISGVTGTAYLAANNTLYTVNLAAGTASQGVAINTTALTGTVRGISAVTPAAAAPEPGTLVLLGTGLVSIGGITVRRRKNKKA